MVRKRRRAKYTWMPTLGGEESAGDNQYFTSYFGSEITANAPSIGPTDIYVTSLVPDQSFLNDNTTVTPNTSLRDQTEGQDWLLKRIVGKLHVSVGQFATPVGSQTPVICKVTAGFFVARAVDRQQDQPDAASEELDPASSLNVRQPWIWRRNWVLMNGLATETAAAPDIWEVNNGLMSVADGPHIDSKVARRIRREERLWFTIVAYGYDDLVSTQASYGTPGRVKFSLDYRILGAMRRSNNRSVF